MAKPKHRIIERARSAKHGRFVKRSYAEKHPDTTIIDRMKVHKPPKKK